MDAFFKAIAEGNESELQRLLDSDSRLASARSPEGVSAILLALYLGKGDFANKMLKYAPELDQFECAGLDDTAKLLSLLKSDKGLVNTYSSDGFTPLHLACFFGKVATAKLLLEHGADPNAVSKNPPQLKPINSAAASRDLSAAFQLVELLLNHGADIKAAQKGGFSALHSAAANGNLSLVNLLVEHGADKNAKSDDGKTPQDFARERNQEDVVKILT